MDAVGALQVPFLIGSVAQRLDAERTGPQRKSKTHRFYIFVTPEPEDEDTFYRLVDKVEFILDPSFPDPRQIVQSPPFMISAEAWGESNVTVLIHFSRQRLKRQRGCDDPVELMTSQISKKVLSEIDGKSRAEACVVLRHHVRLHRPVINSQTHPAVSSLRFAPNFSSQPVFPPDVAPDEDKVRAGDEQLLDRAAAQSQAGVGSSRAAAATNLSLLDRVLVFQDHLEEPVLCERKEVITIIGEPLELASREPLSSSSLPENVMMLRERGRQAIISDYGRVNGGVEHEHAPCMSSHHLGQLANRIMKEEEDLLKRLLLVDRALRSVWGPAARSQLETLRLILSSI